MGSYELVLYEKQRKGVLITLNRPKQMNSFNEQLRVELHKALEEAEADPEVRAIVLTGAGNAFSAGADMALGATSAQTDWPAGVPKGQSVAQFLDGWRVRDRTGIKRLQQMWELSKPVIGAINGWAMGWGSWYALTTHLTIASERAVFAQPEVRHISNSSYLLTALCGWKAANRWALTGDHFDVQEAYRIGMVNQVVPHESLMDEARALARRIALVPEPAISLNKAIAMQGMQAAGVHSGLLLEGALSTLAHTSHNEYREQLLSTQRKEGTKAYLKLRDGPFQPEPMGPRSAKGRQAKANKSEKGD